jgi:hypothetical protein
MTFGSVIAIGAALAAAVIGIGIPQALAGMVPNQLVCSTSTNRCYQSNGVFDPNFPCKHIYNVSWAIGAE